MIIAAIRLDLSVPEAQSLKDKRRMISSLMDKIRRRFGASVAEVEAQDLWQRAVIGVALISGDTGHVRSMADKVTAFVESHWEGEICGIDVEIL